MFISRKLVFTAINMSRTVSARIPKELHEELRERCNKVGCSINDFLEASIEFALNGHSEFDFGDDEDFEEDDEPNEIEQEPLKEKSPTPNIQLVEDKYKSHYDRHGNYWTYNENSKKWTCHINLENARIIS